MTNAKKFKDLITNLFELSKTVDGVKTVYISGDFTKHYILKNYGNVYCYYDNTGDLKADFDFYNSIHGEDVIRLFEGLMEEYNPTENFFGEELTTVEHTGTVGNTSNSTVDNKTSAYDSDNLVNDSQVIGNSGGTTTFNNTDTTTYSRHGNLGVATPSDLLGGEAKLRFNTFVEHYINRWINGCMVGYGDEENEVTFEPDVEYASKTYVDNKVTELAENVDDALNNLTVIVNEHGSSISALDNSLSGLIEEVDTFEDSVDTELTDHGLRITALENTPSGGISYSTEERVIGTWIDGRPVYQKTFEFLNNPLRQAIFQSHGISNLDFVVDFSAFFCNKGVSTTMIPNVYMGITVHAENIEISTTNTNTVTRDFYATIQYVKTTV